MKCPYNTTKVEITTPLPALYRRLEVMGADETPDVLHLTNNVTIYTTTETMSDCLGSDCGAYQGGFCKRVG